MTDMLRDHAGSSGVAKACQRLLALFTLCLLLASGNVFATTVTTSGNGSNGCTDRENCCITFTITFSTYTDKVKFTLMNTGPNDNCIDWTCFESGDDPPTATHTRVSNGVFEVTFNPPKINHQTYTFTLCAPASCWTNWSAVKWEASNGSTAIDDGIEYLHTCVYGNSGCSGCDKTELYPIGDDIVVCFSKKGSAGAACSVRVVITPALKDCNGANAVLDPPPGWHTNTQTDYGVAPSDWTEITLEANGPTQCLDRCYTMCFKLAGCTGTVMNGDNPIPHSVKVYNEDDDSAACSPPPSRTFKPVFKDGKIVSTGEQNYPNPLSAMSGFTTMIPFDVTVAGTVYLTVTDQTGKAVLHQEYTTDGPGRFAFNVDGGSLTAGTYYYSVEAPKGKVLIAKSMVVIR